MGVGATVGGGIGVGVGGGSGVGLGSGVGGSGVFVGRTSVGVGVGGIGVAVGGTSVEVGVTVGVKVTVEVRVGVGAREMEPPQAAVKAAPSIRTAIRDHILACKSVLSFIGVPPLTLDSQSNHE